MTLKLLLAEATVGHHVNDAGKINSQHAVPASSLQPS